MTERIKQTESKENTDKTEVRIYPLVTGETLAVFCQDQVPLSWFKINKGGFLASVTLDEDFVNQPWIQERVGKISPSELTIIVKGDKSDFVCVDPNIRSIDVNSRKYTTSEKLEIGEDPRSNTPKLRGQKQAAKNRLVSVISERIKANNQTSSAQNAIEIGSIENQRLFYIPVDEEIEKITQIDGDNEALDPQFNTQKSKNLDPSTGRVKLFSRGDEIIVKVDEHGNFTFLSSNFGKAPVIAISFGELKLGENGLSLNQTIEKTCQSKNIKNQKQIKGHLLRKILARSRNKIPEYQLEDQKSELFDIEQIRTKVFSKYPQSLIDYLKGNWYTAQIALNLEIIRKQLGDPPSIQKVANFFGESLAEYLLENPKLDTYTTLAEYKLLTLDLPEKAEEMIRKSGIGILGDSTQSLLLDMYLSTLRETKSTNWDNILERILQQNQLTDEDKNKINRYIHRLNEQNVDLVLKQVRLAKYVAGILFDNYVREVGINQFDPSKISEQAVDHEDVINRALSDKVKISDDNDPWNIFNQIIREPQVLDLGKKLIIRINSLRQVKTEDGNTETKTAEFNIFPEYKVRYPQIVINALIEIYREYNEAFRELVSKNKECPEDYRYAIDSRGTPINRWVQIDMVGLPEKFLELAENGQISAKEVKRVIRNSIFEIENSLAMYQLLMKMFSQKSQASKFETEFKKSLDKLRKEMGGKERVKILLLAPTYEKYNAMLLSEFGRRPDDPQELTEQDVKQMSGFDMFMGPDQFRQFINQNNGKCPENVLIYVRASDPVAKLANPDCEVANPLLSDPQIRQIIKERSITFNIDDPNWKQDNPKRINDTKGYLVTMGIAFELKNGDDILSKEALEYLAGRGINPLMIESLMVKIRAKPLIGAYGCYGHHVVDLTNGDDRDKLKEDIQKRGKYVMQPELRTPKIIEKETGKSYLFIDRVFFCCDTEGNYNFMGGFRSCMPEDSIEAQRARNHGSSYTCWAEII